MMPPHLLAGLMLLWFVVLAGPVSAALAKAHWTTTAPRAALVLFQAVCLSAGLCLVGAGFVVALNPLGDEIVTALARFGEHLWNGHPLTGMSGGGIVAGTLATGCAGVLFGALLRSLVLALRRRHTHRLVLDLLTGGQRPEIGGELLVGVRILDHAGAVAYTLPGWHSRVVLTAGLVNLLAPEELAAVVAHERAHVRSRHDLLVLPFQAWVTVLGWIPGARAAGRAVGELTEMLADDWACGRTSGPALRRALAKVALAGVPNVGTAGAVTPAVAGHAVAGRVERLRVVSPGRRGAVTAAYVAAALLVAVPTAALLIGWR